MANPHLGEVTFKAGDDDYILSFSANAMCELEAALGTDVDTLIEKFKSGKGVNLDMLRVMFWQGLLDHHESLTLDDAKRVLKKLKANEMGELVGRALVLSMPKADDEGGAASPPPPGEPQSGAGPASSTSGTTPEGQKPNSGG